MLITEEEYNKPINFRTKQIDNSILALKFHDAVRETMNKLLKEPYKFTSLLDGKTYVTKESKEYLNKTYPTDRINLEFRKHLYRKGGYYYWNTNKYEVHEFKLDRYKDITAFIKSDTKRTMSSWDESYFKDFIKFSSLQSKNFKKKIMKVVYIFENENSDRKYRKIFNFLVNYYNLNFEVNVNNYDSSSGKKIDNTKVDYYTDVYYIKDYKKILPKKEQRNRNINKILKSKNLVESDN
jgi:hypothetical protein